MDKFKTFKKNTSVLSSDIPGGAILLNLDTKYYYNLNETGFRIWQMIDDDHTPLDMAKKLVSYYEIDVQNALASVIKLMGQLESEGLIVAA